MTFHYRQGAIFKADSLKFCTAEVNYDPKTGEITVDHTKLTPNPVQHESVGKSRAVWHGSKKVGYVDERSIDPARSSALWKITEVIRNPHGGGYSHCVSGRSESWATYSYVAVRVNEDGSDHETKETLCFNNRFYVSGMTFI